jgi:predicted nuclease of predicted toxin-antitoxin system
MRFLADESIDQPIVAALRKAGYDVSYIAELEPGLDDAAVLAKANQEGRLLLTADKDFGEMVVRQQSLGTGVILLRLAGLSNQYKAALALRAIQENSDRLSGHLVVVRAERVRIRPLRLWE